MIIAEVTVVTPAGSLIAAVLLQLKSCQTALFPVDSVHLVSRSVHTCESILFVILARLDLAQHSDWTRQGLASRATWAT